MTGEGEKQSKELKYEEWMKKGNRKNLREKNRDKIKVKTFDRIVIN